MLVGLLAVNRTSRILRTHQHVRHIIVMFCGDLPQFIMKSTRTPGTGTVVFPAHVSVCLTRMVFSTHVCLVIYFFKLAILITLLTNSRSNLLLKLSGHLIESHCPSSP